QSRVAPARRIGSKPRQAARDKAAEQVREPSAPVESELDSRPPDAAAEPAVAGHPSACRRMSIQVERIRDGEPNDVAPRLTRARARLPVDHARELLTDRKQVAEPEIAVDRGAGAGRCAQARLRGLEPGQ